MAKEKSKKVGKLKVGAVKKEPNVKFFNLRKLEVAQRALPEGASLKAVIAEYERLGGSYELDGEIKNAIK